MQAGTACGCGLCAYAARSSTGYQRFFAYAMATGMGEYEEKIAPVKRDLFSKAFDQGPVQNVVEVGMGTGPNLQYIPADALKAGGPCHHFDSQFQSAFHRWYPPQAFRICYADS